MMDDDALAPVIGVMLILAIGVTVFAVYTSTYLPGLKQQAEVGHIKEVESGFLRFSSDIDNAIAAGKNMIGVGRSNQSVIYSETIPLGGGDILVNSMKSGGVVRIQRSETPFLEITINDNTNSSYLVKYSYIPTDNFWIDQGYLWEAGNVTVAQSKEGRTAMITENYNFPGSLVDYRNISNTIYITMVNFTFEESSGSISGNGNAILKLNSTAVNLTPVEPVFEIIFSLPESPIRDELKESIGGKIGGYEDNSSWVWNEESQSWIRTVTYSTDPPTFLILNKIEMVLGVH